MASGLKHCACSSHYGVYASVLPVSSMEQLCFFLIHREGWAEQMKTSTLLISGQYFLPPCAHFWTIAVLGRPGSCQCLACMGDILQWNPSWGSESLCSTIAEQRRTRLYYWQPVQNGKRMVTVIRAGTFWVHVNDARRFDTLRLDLIHDARV